MLLPSDVWCCIYQASTPNRRRTVLGLNTEISDVIRPSIVACVSDDPWTPLPSGKRFVHLSDVYTDLTAAQAQENWEFATFQSETQTVRMHFKSPHDYEQGIVTEILGVQGIELSVFSFAAMLEARRMVSRCTGILKAKFVGDTYMEHDWKVDLRSASLEDVAFEDLLMPYLDMPSLRRLSSVTAWNISILPDFFKYLPRLESLIITAQRAPEAIHLPPSLRLFHMFLRRPGALEIHNLDNLRELHLFNIVTTIRLPPFLTDLTLVNTRLGLTATEIISHLPLRHLVVVMTNPPTACFMEWKACQEEKGAQGYCLSDAISLQFEL